MIEINEIRKMSYGNKLEIFNKNEEIIDFIVTEIAIKNQIISKETIMDKYLNSFCEQDYFVDSEFNIYKKIF